MGEWKSWTAKGKQTPVCVQYKKKMQKKKKKKKEKAERQKCLLKLKDKGSLMLSRWNNFASTRMSPVSPLAWRSSSLRTLVWFSVCPNFWIDKEWPTAITEALHSIQKTNWSKAPNYFPVQVSYLHRLFDRWCGRSTNRSSWRQSLSFRSNSAYSHQNLFKQLLSTATT